MKNEKKVLVFDDSLVLPLFVPISTLGCCSIFQLHLVICSACIGAKGDSVKDYNIFC